MFTLPLILAAGSLPLIFGAPVPSDLSRSADTESHHSLQERATNTYATVFGGSGSTDENWPPESAWIQSYDKMFEDNLEMMTSSCLGGFQPTTHEEAMYINESIVDVSISSGVDKRFILAVVMQESKGCVRVQTTTGEHANPGLMQSHQGEASCNKDGKIESKCPKKTIYNMIKEGTEGTSSGDGLKQCLARYGGSGPQAYYKAARCYNSGSVAPSGNLGQAASSSTACYCSDIANRLLGWSKGTSKCDANIVGTLTGSSWSGGGSSGGSSADNGSSGSAPSATPSAAPQPSYSPEPAVPEQTPAASPVAPSSTPSVLDVQAVPTPSQSVNFAPKKHKLNPQATHSNAPSTASGASSGAPLYPHAIASCKQYVAVASGDYCMKVSQQFGITASQLQQWNKGLDKTCSNLWKGYKYCVKA